MTTMTHMHYPKSMKSGSSGSSYWITVEDKDGCSVTIFLNDWNEVRTLQEAWDSLPGRKPNGG